MTTETDNENDGTPSEGSASIKQDLPPAAIRALEEAEQRRLAAQAREEAQNTPAERGGPKGVEPTRYGDWERKGRAVDF